MKNLLQTAIAALGLSCSQAYGTFVCNSQDAFNEIVERDNITRRMVIISYTEKKVCNDWKILNWGGGCIAVSEDTIIIDYDPGMDGFLAYFYDIIGKKRLVFIPVDC